MSISNIGKSVERIQKEEFVSKILQEVYDVDKKKSSHTFTPDELKKIGKGQEIIGRIAEKYSVHIHPEVPQIVSSVEEWVDEIEEEIDYLKKNS